MNKPAILTSFMAWMLFPVLKAQAADINFGEFSSPVPSVSSLNTYANTPVSIATGTPDISMSLMSLPTYSGDVSLNVGISYNYLNNSDKEPASEVGQAWTKFAGGVISRSINEELDEINDNAISPTYFKNAFDDLYYYSLPGLSGKFRFVRDTDANTFRLVNLSANKAKIEYVADPNNTATLIVNSFTITDQKGIKYIFNDYSRSNTDQLYYTYSGKIFRSAFFLTEIRDPNGVQLASFTYQKDNRYKSNGVIIMYQSCKIKTITSPGFGTVEFNYLYNPTKENTMNDQYQLQDIVLKDSYGHIISQYAFEYFFTNTTIYGLRYLAKVKKLNKNNEVSETTEFEYYPNGDYRRLIKRIDPTGGVIEYDYGGRINEIKYYNTKTDTTPQRTIKYDYRKFDGSGYSSGKYIYPDGEINGTGYSIYKNVKVTSSDDNNGYTKYYFKVPDDFPKVDLPEKGSGAKYWAHYNLISSGLLDKKEIYDAQGKLLVSEQSSYTFEDVPGAEIYNLADIKIEQGSYDYSKLGWLKKIVTTSTTYFDSSQSVQEQSETNFNVFNFEVASTRKFLNDTTKEEYITYPESGYSNLANANIKSTPVIIEEKTDGELTSRTETKFDNASSTRPTSLVRSGISNQAASTVTIDQYDDKGNAVQITSSTGMPTAIIWGYNKTKPIARIEGATYAQVSSLAASIVNASNEDAADPTKEALLLVALDNLRKTSSLQNFQITTYTYDPLIGTTTMTPPNGIREIYQYDTNNRLQKIVDMNGVTLKEYKYNYKN
ncbi:hypothetical protein [Chryseobacterium gossypii]|uniref:hypothetical protein n=1 Tax=Chryseobacterium gossypii TaxID=3231602 RepID=UPI0035251798